MLIATTKILMRSPIFNELDPLERLKLLVKLLEDKEYPVEMAIQTTQHGWIALGQAQHVYYQTTNVLEFYSKVMILERPLFVTNIQVIGVGTKNLRHEYLKGSEVQFTYALEMK